MNLCLCGCGEPVKEGRRFSRQGHYARISREPIEQKYRIDSETGHWHWQRAIVNGYGAVQHPVTKKTMGAHRYVYELHKGTIPEGMTLDHLCRVRDCVNPDHLEPVTRGENVLRGEGLAAINKRKTECLRGHPLTPDNLYLSPRGFRYCLACRAVRAPRYVEGQHAYQRAKREAKVNIPKRDLLIGDVAILLGVTAHIVRKWAKQGLLPSRRNGTIGYHRFDRADVEEFASRPLPRVRRQR